MADFLPPAFKFSPGGDSVAIVLRSGNLGTGLNLFRLCIWRVADIQRYLQTSDMRQLPRFAREVAFESASIWPAIDQLRWLTDNRHLVFIGRRTDGVGQVFRYDVDSGELKQLTHHSRNIMRFDLSADGETLLFAAHDYPDWASRNARGYTVRSDYVSSLAWTDPTDMPPEVRHFIFNLRAGVTTAVNMPPSEYPEKLTLSPSGRMGVAVNYDVRGIPTKWAQYDVVEVLLGRAVSHSAGVDEGIAPSSDAFGSRSGWLSHFMLVDTTVGAARRLLDSPVIASEGTYNAVWNSSGTCVFVAPAYLPLTNDTNGENDRRRSTRFVLEIDVRTEAVREVTQLRPGLRLAALRPSGDSTLDIQYSEYKGALLPPETFRRRGNRWTSVKSAPQEKERRTISLRVVQDLNTPYEIEAIDLATGKHRIITDLNPSLRSLSLGTVSPYSWTDRFERTFTGGLVVPSDFLRNRRYPVVLQTYGFRPHEFLVDGPNEMASAYAARALAGAGILVLQMPFSDPARPARGSCTKWENCGESPRWMAMVEAAIDALDRDGLIDRSLVGLIGFSREGMKALHTVTFSNYTFKAATIADSVMPSLFSYVLSYGYAPPGMFHYEQEDMLGAPFWGDGKSLWYERSPSFNLEKVRTPLRFEAYYKGIPAFWDVFALLKRNGRPSEMIHIPQDSHNLQTPLGRYTSQQGNVDWFKFWLLGQEDDDPAKAEQFLRWRRLREQSSVTRRVP